MDFSIAIGLQLIDNFSRQLFTIKESVSHFNQELNQTQSKLQSFRETLKKAFDPQAIWNASEKLEDFTAKVAQATALPLASLSKTLNAYKSLELAQAEMEVALMTKEGLPTEKIEELNKQVEELGVKLPGTTADFYRVVTALKSAGMEIDKIIGGGLKSASYLWVLFKEEANPKEVAEMVQNFSNAFKIAGQDFEAFADQLQRLKFASGLTLTQIGYATKYFSAELNQLGATGLKSSKLMLAWLGTLKQFGVAGETAGTSLRSVLQRIPELDKHLEKLRKEGLDFKINLKDFYDEKGAFKLEEFLMTVRKELSAIQDPLKKMHAIRELFDMEGMRAIAPLLAATKDEALMYLEEIKKSIEATNDPKKIAEFREQYEQLKKQIESGGFSGLEKMTKELDNQASLQQRLNRLMNTFANALEAVEGTFVNLMSVIGSLVAPTLITILNPINDFIGKLADLIQEHQTLSKVLALTVGGFTSLLAIMGAISLAVASFMKLFSLAFAPIRWLMSINLVRNFTNILRSAIIGIRALGAAFLTTPIGWIGLAIGTAAFLIYKYWEPISGFFKGLWEGIKESLKGLEPAWDVFNRAGKLLEPVLNALKGVYNFIKNLFKPVDDAGKSAENLGLRFGKAIGNFISAILDVKGAFNWLKNNISEFYNWVKSGLQDVYSWLKDKFAYVQDLIAGFKQGFVSALKPAYSELKGAFQELYSALKPVYLELKEVYKALYSTFQQVYSKLKPTFQELYSTFKELYSALKAFFQAIGEAFGEFLKAPMVIKVVEFITSLPSKLFEAGKKLVDLWSWLKSTWEKVSNALLTAWEWLKSSWKKVLEVFINIHPIVILLKALNKLVQHVFGLDLFTAGKKLVESLWKGIESLAMKPVEAMKNIVQKIRNLLPFSPAKEGPLKDIHRIKFIETITASLNPDPLLARMKDIAIKMSQFALPSPILTGLRPALAGGHTTITVNIGPIQVSGAEGNKVAQSIANDLEREIRRVLAKIADERNRRSY
jgi:TP901 family phage tail tape measure protein